MARTKLPMQRINISAAPTRVAWPERLTQVAFVLALAVVFARATMLESVRDAFEVQFKDDPIRAGPGPAAGLVLDLVCCIPALLVLVRRLVDPTFVLRFAWSHAAFFALALCAAFSSLWAADRFIALVTGAHVVAAAALLWAMVQVTGTWLRLRLVAGVCFGLLLACSAHGLIYRFVDLPDLRRTWERDREMILAQRGWEPGSFEERQFANKILGGEMIGFHVSPNAFAAVIVILTAVSIGVAIQRIVNRDERAWLVPVVAAVFLAAIMVYWTHSKTAMATLALAVCAFIVLAPPRIRTWLATHSRQAYWAGLIVCVLGVAAVAAHGIYHGGLFEGRFSNSLHFRWRYWVGASEIFRADPLLGVGWGNFGNFYLAHRLPEASEEVKDPHNFLIRAFVELGIIGGVLLVAWLARMGWELTRPYAPQAPLDDDPRDPQYSMATALRTMGAICGLGLILNIAASIDWAQSVDYGFIEFSKRFLYALLVFAGGLIIAIRSTKRQELDGRAAPWVLYGCLIGMGTLLVQNLIDISLFEAGPMLIFVMLAGAVGGIRAAGAPVTERAPRPAAAAAALVVGSLGWAAALLLVVIPVIVAQNHAFAGDNDVRYGRMPAAVARFRGAFREVPGNADYAFRAARALIMEQAHPDDVRTMLDETIAADPTLIKAYLMRAEYELRQPAPDAVAVRDNYERAVALNPADVDVRVRYAAALERLGLKPEAAAQYRAALEFNGKLPLVEPERLKPERIAEIEKKIAELGMSAD